eukprot:1365708-Rhodomonas_salina.2
MAMPSLLLPSTPHAVVVSLSRCGLDAARAGVGLGHVGVWAVGFQPDDIGLGGLVREQRWSHANTVMSEAAMMQFFVVSEWVPRVAKSSGRHTSARPVP